MEFVTKDTSAKVKVNEAVFGYDYNEGLIHQAVVQFMANARSGNSAQKTRAEVRGGGKKPWRQKGTGRARAGTIRSPIWRKGGVTFASKPEMRNYTRKLNKKMYNRAIRSIISQLQRSEDLIIVSDFTCETPRTKDFLQKISALEVSNALIVVNEIGENEYLASRNLVDFDIVDVRTIDPVNLLRFEKVIMSVEAVAKLEELLK